MKEEAQAREAALQLRWKRERAGSELSTAQARLKGLEANLAQPETATAALKSILALLGEVPAGVLTRSTDFMPGGFECRDVLRKIVTDALAEVVAKRQRLETDLPLAQQRVEQAARAVAQLNPTHAGDVHLRMPEFAARGTGAVR
jgi:hypothetical protein